MNCYPTKITIAILNFQTYMDYIYLYSVALHYMNSYFFAKLLFPLALKENAIEVRCMAKIKHA